MSDSSGAGVGHTGGGSGASHGGRGGAGRGTNAVMSYCTIHEKCLWGSGGGFGTANLAGGRGGGMMHIDVVGTFVLNGKIFANGERAYVRIFTISYSITTYSSEFIYD